MSTVAFDTLAYANRLKEAGVPPEQAEAHVAAQADFLTQHILSEVATKDDLRTLKSDLKGEMDARFSEVDLRFEQVDTRLAEMKGDMDVRFERVDTRLAEIRGDIDARFERVDTGFAELETRLSLRIGAMVAALALFMGILEFYQ